MSLSIMDKVSARFSGWKISLIAILLLMFVLRLALPQYIKYFLFPIVAVAGIIAIFMLFKRDSPIRPGILFKIFLPVFAVLVFYLFAFFLTENKQSVFIRDFVNVIAVFAILIVIITSIRSETDLLILMSKFRIYVIISSTIVAFFGLIKLYYQLRGTEFGFLYIEGFDYPDGTSLSVDNNFFTLICIFGILLMLPYLFKKHFLINWILIQLSLVALIMNIFFSTSRRGILIAYTVLLLLIIIWFLSVTLKNDKLKSFSKNTIGSGIILFSIFSYFLYFLWILPPLERNKKLSFSSFNQVQVRSFVNMMTLSAKSIFDGEKEYTDINSENWQSNFDPRYPYSGWASGNYTAKDTLTGDNVEIVPGGAVGALIDNTSGRTTESRNSYYISRLFERPVTVRKRYLASVYCYVSADFNGEWVRISAHGKVRGHVTANYDQSRKGVWQKLETSFYADSGVFSNSLFLSIPIDESGGSMTGYMIFAYPELKEISFNPKIPLTWAGSEFEEVSSLPGQNSGIIPSGSKALKYTKSAYIKKDSLLFITSHLNTYSNIREGFREVVTIYAYVSEDFNGDEVFLSSTGRYTGLGKNVYNLKNKGAWEKLVLSVSSNKANINYGVRKRITGNSDSITGYVLFAHPEDRLIEFDPKEPLSWATKKYKPLNRFSGENHEIVPTNSIGYLLDNESEFAISKLSLTYSTTTNLGKKTLLPDIRYVSSVYCFVSKDFNGENVRLAVRGSVEGSRSNFYDLNKKGVWQRLYLNNYGDSGYIEPFLSFIIPGKKNVDYLNGHVVFAYPEFNSFSYSPGNPYSYSKTSFKRAFPLVGENSSILPSGVAGYHLDRTASGDLRGNVFRSVTDFLSKKVSVGDSVFASVFCYVSDDFNGSEVFLQIQGKIDRSAISRFNLKKKGEWIKLETKGKAISDGKLTGVLYFSKKDVADFSTLKGHVIFAYPIIKILKPGTLKSSHNLTNPQKNMQRLHYSSLMSSFEILKSQLNLQVDSSYFNSDFQKENASDNFFGPRLDRWRYAMYIFKNDYSAFQRLFGGAFGYTRKFGLMFSNENTEYDYPHNPLISVLLYSGILGLTAYFWLLYKTFYYYWKFRRKYWPFFLCFIVTFFFSFFSANNPFEPMIMGLFVVLPFVFEYIHATKYLENISSKKIT